MSFYLVRCDLLEQRSWTDVPCYYVAAVR